MPSEPSLSKEMLTGQRLCHSKSHQDSVLSALNQQRKDGQLCDVTLVAGEQKFHAHKAVLAACSDYFRVGETSALVAVIVTHHVAQQIGMTKYLNRRNSVTCLEYVISIYPFVEMFGQFWET
ncbi:Kelch-like protein 32 [Characodon lateralis]|uniref:Kelch-like protein 32 n=1 Tax=Characodon lateralis TaxID=208331 RepID=A0ABU7DYJ3_9TELE|nr:Kelch-like protein 32 [Characodon lateralis]